MLRTVGKKISGGFASGGQKFKEYLINLFNDYKSVATETVTDVRAKPWKGIGSISAIGGIIYAIKTNPDEHHFLASIVRNQSTLTLIGDPVRNPRSNDQVQSIMQLFNENRVARLNFVLFSIIWRRDYGRDCDLYAAQCKVLKPNWRDFYTRIIDVGAFGRWAISERSMRDYDVNPNEPMMPRF